MDWTTSLEHLKDGALAKPSPPYVLLVAGLLILLACAFPLIMILLERLAYWSSHLSADELPSGGRLQVIVPFLGTSVGAGIFLAAGFEVLGMPVLPSLFLAFTVTIVGSYAAWLQLGRLFGNRALRSYLKQLSDFPTDDATSELPRSSSPTSTNDPAAPKR